MTISDNIKLIKEQLPEHIKLVAVSKTMPNEIILEAYRSGHKIFGENKVQELVSKYEALPKDIEWHYIGHLQRNKVKYIAPFVYLIHSVDSLRLLQKINEEGIKNNRIINCLLQIHIAQETTKYGLDMTDLEHLLISEEFKTMNHIKVVGLMGMATYTDKQNLIKTEFDFLFDCYKKVKEKFFKNSNDFKELSMGMTNDYKIAVESGSSMLRIGSLIFGERQ